MKIFIVFAHPEHQSFNGAMFRRAVETFSADGHEVRTSDLHALKFDPVSGRHNFLSAKDPDYFKQQIEEMHATETYGFAEDIENEIGKLEWCELMIWQFPLWWSARHSQGVGRSGVRDGADHGGDKIYANGVFKGKRALLSLTTGGPAPAYLKGAFNGDIHAILRPIQRGMLQFVGFDVLAPQLSYGPARLEPDARTALLASYAERLKNIADETPLDVGIY